MKAFEIISERSRWTKGCYAQDKFGKKITPNSPEAIQWDAMGAIRKAYGDNTKGYWAAFKKLRAEVRKIGFMEISFWHDTEGRTHHQVIEMLKKLDI